VKRAVPFMALVLALLILPSVSAQLGAISASSSITVVRGDYSTGTLVLTNTGNLDYSVVSYRAFWVEDARGNRVDGFNFTMFPRIFTNWERGQNRTIKYTLTASKDVLPGEYTLYLRFIATHSNNAYVVRVAIPVKVLASPLRFGRAYYYVPGRGDAPYVFLGEKVVVYSHVVNIGHFNASVDAFAAFKVGGKYYSVVSKKINVPPGDTVVSLTLPVGWDYPVGEYTLIYTLAHEERRYTYTKKLTVSLGVRLVGVSVEREGVVLNDTLKAYVTILSERRVKAVVSCVAVVNGTHPFWLGSVNVSLTPGTRVVQLGLPTFKPGNISAVVDVIVNGRSAGRDTVSYRVYEPPSIAALIPSLENSTLRFNVILRNPTPDDVDGTLSYEVLANGSLLQSDVLDVTLPPGKRELSFVFKVPAGTNVTYRFKLEALGRVSVKEGSLWVPAPKPPGTITSSTSTTSNETTTTSNAGKGFPWWPVVAVIFLVVLVLIVYLGRRPKRKRPRKTPKRRSPLGKFRRPRPPHFREMDSLPKKK